MEKHMECTRKSFIEIYPSITGFINFKCLFKLFSSTSNISNTEQKEKKHTFEDYPLLVYMLCTYVPDDEKTVILSIRISWVLPLIPYFIKLTRQFGLGIICMGIKATQEMNDFRMPTCLAVCRRH